MTKHSLQEGLEPSHHLGSHETSTRVCSQQKERAACTLSYFSVRFVFLVGPHSPVCLQAPLEEGLDGGLKAKTVAGTCQPPRAG